MDEEIEDALQLIVSTAELSVKMKKELKQTILDTVSTLRDLTVKLHVSRDSKSEEISKLEKQVDDLKAELEECRHKSAKVLGTPSSEENNESAGRSARSVAPPSGSDGKHTAKVLGTPSSEENHEPAGKSARRVAPPSGRDGKHTETDRTTGKRLAPTGGANLYSEVVGSGTAKKLFQLTVKSIGNTTQENATELLKAKINPTEIKVGINKFKILINGNIIIGTNTKQEIEALEKEITSKCRGELEANVHKLRKPRLIVYNIPDISTTTLEDTLLTQNPELGLTKGDIVAKFDYTTKNKNRNMVIEVEAKVRKLLLHSKIKLGWHLCKAEDYVVATRCFKCSRYNHRHRECKGEETCPICAGAHRLKDCVAEPKTYKCVNCTIYNKYNPHNKIYTNHSSLDKKCPSMQAILERYRRNTEY